MIIRIKWYHYWHRVITHTSHYKMANWKVTKITIINLSFQHIPPNDSPSIQPPLHIHLHSLHPSLHFTSPHIVLFCSLVDITYILSPSFTPPIHSQCIPIIYNHHWYIYPCVQFLPPPSPPIPFLLIPYVRWTFYHSLAGRPHTQYDAIIPPQSFSFE